MNNWEKFEVFALNKLNSKFKNSEIEFKPKGGKNSLFPDIEVYKNKNHIFNIEAKLSPAQSGQFVLQYSDSKFELSSKNKNLNKFSKKILDYLNSNISTFEEINQNAIAIECEKNILANWIIEHYKSKLTKFIVTSDKIDGFISVVPIESIGEYFNISANIRRKKSGSKHLPKNQITNAIKSLKNHIEQNLQLKILDQINEKGRYKVQINIVNELNYSDKSFGENYFLSLEEPPNHYVIKQKSNTNNINVIFSLEYIGDKEDNGLINLKEFINSKF